MSVNLRGTYVAAGGNYVITITNCNGDNGRIDGSYSATQNHEDMDFAVNNMEKIGKFSWVYSESSKSDGVKPFNIRFAIELRRDDRRFCIYDTWVGYYGINNNLEMTGARSYVNSEGAVKTEGLGTMTFTRQNG